MNISSKLFLITFFLTIAYSFNATSQERTKNEIKPIVIQPKFTKRPPGTTVIATQEYRVQGHLVTKVALEAGFLFYPDKKIHNLARNNIMAGAYFDSSVGTRNGNGSSQMIEGHSMIVGRCSSLASAPNPPVKCWNIFHLFEGKKLNKLWRIKEIEISNVDGWLKKPNITTDTPYTKVRIIKPSNQVAPTRSQIKYVTLVGPKNTKWKEAFSPK